ncbi:polysaccharide deacetylase family protein [Planosporangium sp. 12N6]|uniref:polysaccharide deacetylase family protein n=1 Tax=Planosporangium spinosum TaxID=3402278 RepID=UPI003CF45CF8
MTALNRPVGRRLLLSVGALSLLGGCTSAGYAASGTWKSAEAPHPTPSPASPPPSASPSPSRTPWQIPTPFHPTPGVCPVDPTIVQRPGGPQHYLPCKGTNIALTIDDGPHPEWTPRILSVLARFRVSATFCMIGRQAAVYPSLVKAVIAGGHRVANHSFTHPLNLPELPPEQIDEEINRTTDAITTASGGHRPTLFRAPGGNWSQDVLDACATAGLRPLDWSVDPRDWSLPGVPHIVDTILTKTRPGSIILDHDGGGNRQQTVDALTIALPRLLEAGYRFTHP